MHTNKPLVSVVILNWNGLEDTKICLEHVRKLDYPNLEVIVVDNGSSQNNKDYLAAVPGIIYIDNPVNRGFTGGHIDGLARCSGEFVVLLNNDAVIQKDYITKALVHFDDPNVAVVGGRAYWWNKDAPLLDTSNPFYSYQEVDIYSGEARMLSGDYGVSQVVNNVSGSCVMVRRSTISEVDYLYDRFFAYFEETDLFARVKRAGYTVLYDPELHIWHRNGASSGASSGSHFFYYQIFRNRFIFAVRNFETKFLLHFLYIYTKLATKSFLKYLLRRGDQTMNKAYAQAAFYNVRTLPRTFASRRKLSTKLGKSTYNHTIYTEQHGVSIIIDATKFTDKQFKQTLARVQLDNNPLHEYVLVTRQSQPQLQTINARTVLDRNYFAGNALNIGCLAARFDWMAVGDEHMLEHADTLHTAISASVGTSKSLIAFQNVPSQKAAIALVRKDLFEKMGGLGTHTTLETCISSVIEYASLSNSLLNQPLFTGIQTLGSTATLKLDLLSIKQAITYDDHLLRAQQQTKFDKLVRRYYRLFQVVTFVKWLSMGAVPTRLKIARLKNLCMHTIRLNVRLLAQEFQHIRNEVLLYSTSYAHSQKQQENIKHSLAKTRKHIQDIPVFIICRDRVEPLKQLITWLERCGLTKIVFIDNDSSYKPLVDYFERTPYQVIKLMRNVGHTSPWKLGIIRTLVPNDFYIVTDPDVIPVDDCPTDWQKHFLDIHEEFFAYQKVGFGLKLDDLPKHYPLKRQVIDWESQFWQKSLANNVYEAGVDTTLALYKPYTYTYTLHPSLRTGEPYIARHLPWYANPAKIDEEERYYRYRADHNVSSWNSDTLKDRYAKEMGKQK